MPTPLINPNPRLHHLPATPQTCFWGYFDRSLPPVLAIDPGDIVYVEAITHQAGDAPDLLMDEGITAVYDQVSDRGPGPHIMTGPISIRGAQPGDTLVVKILQIEPRLNYGTNLAGHWGYLYKRFLKERITLYELDFAANLAYPLFGFDFKGLPLYDQPGWITPPDPTTRQSIATPFAVPIRPHFGVMGLAPAESGRINSVPPGCHGGNIDNWRIGAGTTMYYPIQVEGANFFVGDPHMAQGDGELCGTAIEASLNTYLQFYVIKDFGMANPVLETPTQWITHGFDADLNRAMADCAEQMLDFLQRHKAMSADDAYSLISVAVDFGITQVVDQKQGCHGILSKSLFLPRPTLAE